MLNNMDLNLWMWIKDAELKEEKKTQTDKYKKKNNIKSNDKITKARKKKYILEMTVRSEYQLKSHNCYLVHTNATSKADNISRRSRFNISQDLKGF